MGLIIAKFRKKQSNSDKLDKITRELNSIESFQKNTEQQRKYIVGQFLIGSVGIYILTAILFYFYFYPQNFKERLLYLVPFCLAPTFIFLVKSSLSWYFNRKLRKNQNKIVCLYAEKRKILENIMETETYKVARNLLEKYAPEQVRRVNLGPELSPMKSVGVAAVTPMNQMTLRNRTAVISSNWPSRKSDITQTPSTNTRSSVVGPSQLRMGSTMMNAGTPLTTPTPITSSLVPTRQRTFLDKMVDYLIGDGPNNRYALICKQCSGHNGMALMDEFEYVTFKCCYCMAINPARKIRPTAPKLQLVETGGGVELLAALHQQQRPPPSPSSPLDAITASDDTSESERNSGSDTDVGDGEVMPARSTPTLETLYRKQVESRGVGSDDATSQDELRNDDSASQTIE